MERFDVVIVGGGPIGAVTAARAADLGSRVLLAEQRPAIAGPAPCTGLISPRTLTALGASTDTVLREIRGVRVTAPGGQALCLRADQAKAVVVDRTRLEQELLDRARAAGASVRMGTQVSAIADRVVTLRTPDATTQVSAEVIVGADGPGSRVAAWAGLSSTTTRILGIQAVVAAEPRKADEVDVHVGRSVAPEFFAWSVPAEPGQVRVGLGVPAGMQPAAYLKQWLGIHCPGASEITRVSGVIPVCPVPRSQAGRVLLVGDAAGQVKPWSGGGLYTGAICARIAARVAARVRSDGLASLAGYEASWRRAIGPELRFGEIVRRALGSIGDADIDALFAAADRPDTLRDLAVRADIDHPSRLIPHLLTNRRVWKALWALSPALRTWSAAMSRDNSGSSTPLPGDEALYLGSE